MRRLDDNYANFAAHSIEKNHLIRYRRLNFLQYLDESLIYQVLYGNPSEPRPWFTIRNIQSKRELRNESLLNTRSNDGTAPLVRVVFFQ